MQNEQYVIQLMDEVFLADDDLEAVGTEDLFQARRFPYLHLAKIESDRHMNSEVLKIKLQAVNSL